MGAQRLFQTTMVLERIKVGGNDVQIEPALWTAPSFDEARGLAIAAAMEKHPGYSLAAQAVSDITDTTRLWVRTYPPESGLGDRASTRDAMDGEAADVG